MADEPRVPRQPDRPVLVAIDGEPHTDAAVGWALDLASGLGLTVVGVHVEDPYLERFQGELYAQGREEYVEHVGRCLAEEAERTTTAFLARAARRRVEASVTVRRGDPLQELLAEADGDRHALLVVGSKRLRGLAAWRSRRLHARLAAGCPLPLLVVPG